MVRPLKLAAQALGALVVAGLLGLLVWKVVSNGSEVDAKLAKGQTPAAPVFQLPRLDRPGRLSLSAFRGKAVILNFWASWCIPCKQEAPELQRIHERYAKDGLVVLGVDAQDFTGDAGKFMRRYGLTYPMVHDRGGKTLTHYDVKGFPETFFVDRRGRLVGSHIQGPIDQGDNKDRFAQGLKLALGRR